MSCFTSGADGFTLNLEVYELILCVVMVPAIALEFRALYYCQPLCQASRVNFKALPLSLAVMTQRINAQTVRMRCCKAPVA